MKRSWIGFALLLVLLAGGLLVTWGMGKCQEPVARDLDSAAALVLTGNWPGAEEKLNSAAHQWHGSRKFSACFADHTPMEEIDALFAQLEIYAASREDAAFAAGCAELSRKVEAVSEAHGLTWWNFL